MPEFLIVGSNLAEKNYEKCSHKHVRPKLCFVMVKQLGPSHIYPTRDHVMKHGCNDGFCYFTYMYMYLNMQEMESYR